MASITKKPTRKRVVNSQQVINSPSYKKLYRPKAGRILGGVCAGIASFLDYDPTIIRLAFIVVTLLGGSGILIYLILWLIIPSEGSPSEISQQNIKAGADEMRERAQSFAEEAKSYSKKGNPRQTIGIILIILGAFFLLQNFSFFRFDFLFKFWPLLLIIAAIYLIGKND